MGTDLQAVGTAPEELQQWPEAATAEPFVCVRGPLDCLLTVVVLKIQYSHPATGMPQAVHASLLRWALYLTVEAMEQVTVWGFAKATGEVLGAEWGSCRGCPCVGT